MMWGWNAGMMIIGAVIFIIFWGTVITLIIWGIRRMSRGSWMDNREQRTPLDIAKERYAKGEITKEQFEQLKKDLSA